MKVLKYVSRAMLAIAAIYLLFDVILGQKMAWSHKTRNTLLDLAYGLFALSGVLVTVYYYRSKDQKRFRQSLLFIGAAILVFLLLILFS